MKNIFLGLIATILVSTFSFGQDFNLTDYKSVSKIISTTKDDLFINYLKSNPTTLKNVTYKTDLVIMQLQNKNYKIIDLTLTENKICNHAYLLYNVTNKNYSTLYMSIEKTLIKVYDETFNEIYEINTGSGHTQFTLKASCFRKCFDHIQAQICDDAIGTIAWYTNPELAIGAAAYCGWIC